MSGTHNGQLMVNGAGYGETGERILTNEPLWNFRRGDSVRLAALRYLCRFDDRSMRQIAREMGCTGAAINKTVQKLAGALGIPTPRQALKVRYAQSQRGHPPYFKKRRPPGSPPTASTKLLSLSHDSSHSPK